MRKMDYQRGDGIGWGGISCSIHVYHDLSCLRAEKIYLYKYPCQVHKRDFSAQIDWIRSQLAGPVVGSLVGGGSVEKRYQWPLARRGNNACATNHTRLWGLEEILNEKESECKKKGKKRGGSVRGLQRAVVGAVLFPFFFFLFSFFPFFLFSFFLFSFFPFFLFSFFLSLLFYFPFFRCLGI